MKPQPSVVAAPGLVRALVRVARAVAVKQAALWVARRVGLPLWLTMSSRPDLAWAPVRL
jgi:hypothetical protein